MSQTVVIGAGPAGLTAAYELARRGRSVVLLEVAPTVGGLSRSFTLWGQRVDLGPHRFFSRDARVDAFWHEMAEGRCHWVTRLTRILYRDDLYSYPLKPFEVLGKLGAPEAARCVLSHAATKLKPKRASGHESFEDWVVSRFGRRLFEIFFKTYSEKLWGIPCAGIDSDFAAQRIQGFSLWEALVHAVPGLRRKHATLVDRFAYPSGGAGMIYENLARRIGELGGDVRLGTSVKRVLLSGGQVTGVELSDGGRIDAGNVVSTMPLTRLVKGLEGISRRAISSANQLKFRNTIIVYLRIGRRNLFDDNWIYVHSPDLRVGRITNFSNWGNENESDDDQSILALEYWCDGGDSQWQADDKVHIGVATDEIRKTGLIGNAPVIEGHVERINRCYPVYERGYKDLLTPIRDELRKIRGLQVIGRYGAFRYNNQDHSILMGMLAAENVVDGAGHDLWTVNTDFTQYQESELVGTCRSEGAMLNAEGAENKGIA